ncbi:CDP-diacylglycerol--serine O-phosphatidyltransferase [Fictibacillus macauensis ZFHKF-1]|uniref:CDP-diacylglycerol--serine O-phosphatidyltransferase n=1 Tax=Fictibacillus macauensis ZFHKF-1 TaxID=1196324 RepID=I8UCY8_9BACL|nr:CDP-diacylglycerol--serine O-phosphatidyltransferase [Fictibacillus macauensis]EIT84785.1 CDP-diacylglycerol--serine O-phosphatidyltransferase [Fictibacillus macauensis ZFHKF-1]
MKKHIPNLLTLGNLYCGFFSIGYIIHGDSKNATILIFIAIMLDAIDGRAARLLGVANEMGKELDSLADVVSFGVAPAFLAAHTYFSGLDYITGVVMAGLFPVFGAYRLARFNMTPKEESMNHFTGIPITLAGAVVTFLVLFVKVIPLWIFIIAFYGLALLMVSTIKIPSFKSIRMPKNGVIVTLFLFYMFYLVSKAKFERVPIFFYVALAIYILFMIFRFIRVKEPKLPRWKRGNKD